MQLDSQQRTSPTPRPESRVFAITTLIAVLVAVVAVVAIPELRDTATRLGRSAASLVGLAAPVGDFTEVYKRLGIAPLPASVAASDRIAANLAILAREPCDGKAIFALDEALVRERAERSAAEALLGFAQACPNGDGARYRAAQILWGVGDDAKVVSIVDALIAKTPGVVNYHYLRGQSLARAERYREALADYASTIELQKNRASVNERVFREMANIFLATGEPCKAAETILAWIAIAPATRATPAARKLVDEYAAKGCRREAPSDQKL
jgi:tetratricopeptide (TPR) repeat protein